MRKEPLPDILAFFARCCRCQPEALHGKSCAFIIRAEQPKREGKAGAAGCFILCKLESEPKTGAEGRGLRAAVGLRDVSQPRVLGARTGGRETGVVVCPPCREKARADGLASAVTRRAQSRQKKPCSVCWRRAWPPERSVSARRFTARPCACGKSRSPYRPRSARRSSRNGRRGTRLRRRIYWSFCRRPAGTAPMTRGQKLDLIRNADLAGIIVWEASLDTKNHSFAAQLRDTLLR